MIVDITKLCTLQQAADILGMDRNYISFYAKAKRFTPAYIVAGMKFYHVDDVKLWRPVAKKYTYKN